MTLPIDTIVLPAKNDDILDANVKKWKFIEPTDVSITGAPMGRFALFEEVDPTAPMQKIYQFLPGDVINPNAVDNNSVVSVDHNLANFDNLADIEGP